VTPLPPGIRCTAYYYASYHRLPCDLEYLTELGRAAARRARWLGIAPCLVPEGPLVVHAWPEEIFGEVVAAWQAPVPDEVLPPWCPLPQGDQALRDTGY
jgi:hypothetical protein